MSNDFWKHTIDYLGLSTEEKPETDIVNGSTYYEVDTSSFFIWYNGQWYEQGVESEE